MSENTVITLTGWTDWGPEEPVNFKAIYNVTCANGREKASVDLVQALDVPPDLSPADLSRLQDRLTGQLKATLGVRVVRIRTDRIDLEPRSDACVHHWKIEEANGKYSVGTCDLCHDVREFKNSIDDGIAFGVQGSSAPRYAL